jgi:hypothetical protein
MFLFCRNKKNKNKAKSGLVKRFLVGIVLGMLMVVVLLPLLCPATTMSMIGTMRRG